MSPASPLAAGLEVCGCPQASFGATERLQALRELLAACLRPGLPKWHLYTTPPKQVSQCVRTSGAAIMLRKPVCSNWEADVHQSLCVCELHAEVLP